MEKTQEELQAQGAAVRANSDQPRKNDSAYLNMLDDIGKMLEDLADSVSFGGGGLEYDATADLDSGISDLDAEGFVNTKPIYMEITYAAAADSVAVILPYWMMDDDSGEVYPIFHQPAAAVLYTSNQIALIAFDSAGFNLAALEIQTDGLLTNATVSKILFKQ